MSVLRDPSPEHGPADVYDLADLCRLHDVGLDLLARAENVDDLIEAILEEYERRLADLPPDALDRPQSDDPGTAAKVRALVMFAAQASAIKAHAQSGAALRERNRRMEEALDEARRWRERFGAVVAALDVAILVVSPDGTVRESSGAADGLLGDRVGEGRPLPASIRDIPPGGDGDVVVRGAERDERILAVSRRFLGESGRDGEVVLVRDATAHRAATEARHRAERLADVMRTLGVLSHKINNPLTALLGRVQLLRARADADPATAKTARVVEESAQRIADLVRELATVAKDAREEAVLRVLSDRYPEPGSAADGA
jgi:hypothetical protein